MINTRTVTHDWKQANALAGGSWPVVARSQENDVTAEISSSDPYTVPTRYWHRLDDGRLQCDVCPRACRLRESQRGLCFVRGRIDDQVVMTAYGRSSGLCV